MAVEGASPWAVVVPAVAAGYSCAGQQAVVAPVEVGVEVG